MGKFDAQLTNNPNRLHFLHQLLTRQYIIASRHPRLSGIGRRNTAKTKKDSGRAGMTRLNYLIAGLIADSRNALISSWKVTPAFLLKSNQLHLKQIDLAVEEFLKLKTVPLFFSRLLVNISSRADLCDQYGVPNHGSKYSVFPNPDSVCIFFSSDWLDVCRKSVGKL
ncbi:MAG: hypothetical protein HZB31_01085 [Nitrospirae bacterium]|nr:hypothetical protein [Nitrospirota bacterium]